MPLELLLLPGMDGTGTLFGPLRERLPPGIVARAVSYPPDRLLGYDELLAAIVPPARPFAIVAESFSGPLAIRLAARSPSGLRALVLVATFARWPWSDVLRPLRPLVGGYMFAAPTLVRGLGVRAALSGFGAPGPLVGEIVAAGRTVRPAVFAHRLREILRVDVSAELRATSLPLLVLSARHDRLMGDSALRHMRRLRPDATFATLDGPHLLLQCSPVAAAGAIRDFLAPFP